MKRLLLWGAAMSILAAAVAGSEPPKRIAPPRDNDNVLTRYLDWADIHPARDVGRLTIFPITLSRSQPLASVLSMRQALDRGVLRIEELPDARVDQARFTNRSDSHSVFFLAGEIITGGKQNRTLRSDAFLRPGSSAVLPLYCVQKGRWEGGKALSGSSGVAPFAVRKSAQDAAGQDEVWAEVARANKQLKSATPSDDLASAMESGETKKQLSAWRERVVPHLPKGCVGLVAAYHGRIVAADLFNSPELFSAMRDTVLDSYLSQYAWPLPVKPEAREHVGAGVESRDVQAFLRGAYQGRFTPGEQRGDARVYLLRGAPSGQTLVVDDKHMLHTLLMGQDVVPVK